MWITSRSVRAVLMHRGRGTPRSAKKKQERGQSPLRARTGKAVCWLNAATCGSSPLQLAAVRLQAPLLAAALEAQGPDERGLCRVWRGRGQQTRPGPRVTSSAPRCRVQACAPAAPRLSRAPAARCSPSQASACRRGR